MTREEAEKIIDAVDEIEWHLESAQKIAEEAGLEAIYDGLPYLTHELYHAALEFLVKEEEADLKALKSEHERSAI